MAQFPALDPEPPAPTLRDRLRYLAVAVLALIVLAGAAAGGWAIDRAVAGDSPAARAPDTLLTNQTSGSLTVARPNGTIVRTYHSVGYLGGGTAFVAPGGRTLLTGAGEIITLKHGRPLGHSTKLYGPLSKYSAVITSTAPFANGAADVVFSTQVIYAGGRVGETTIRITSVDGTRVRSLGTGDSYAGDPQQAAAFVTVPAPKSRQHRNEQATIDRAIEHRVAGGATTTLIKVGQIVRALGIPDNPPLSLDITPDPTGRYLAVSADDPQVGASSGLLVLSRTGKVVGHPLTAPDGPIEWSPSGNRLLYSGDGRATIATPTGASRTIGLPEAAGLLQSCAWSPAETRIACAGYPGQGGRLDAWVLLNRRTGSAKTLPARGVPLLWRRPANR